MAVPATAAERSHTSHEAFLEWWIADEIRARRAQVGLGPLEGRSDLQEPARDWSDHLAAQGRLEHDPDYSSEMCCWQRAGEILAAVPVAETFDAAALREAARAAIRAWDASPAHRDAMLGEFDEVGVGVTLDYPNSRVWITARLRDRTPGSSAPGSITYQPGGSPPAAPASGYPCGSDGDAWGEPKEALARSTLRRVAGEDRVATALALASDLSGPRTVLLASAAGYADSLAAGGLAGTLDAPVLLTPPGSLDRRVADRLAEWGPDEVVLLGGTTALSSSVADGVRHAVPGTTVTRLRGSHRYATAAAAAERLRASGGAVNRALVVLGEHGDPSRAWPDAVTVSSLASLHQHPILLTTPKGLPPATAETLRALRPRTVVVVGGPASIHDVVLDQIRKASGATVSRVAGASRYDTALAVARLDARWRGDAEPRVLLAHGENWPDALSAGPAAARRDALLLLFDGRDGGGGGDAQLATLVREFWRLDITLAGGAGAISPTREARIRQLVPCT